MKAKQNRITSDLYLKTAIFIAFHFYEEYELNKFLYLGKTSTVSQTISHKINYEIYLDFPEIYKVGKDTKFFLKSTKLYLIKTVIHLYRFYTITSH